MGMVAHRPSPSSFSGVERPVRWPPSQPQVGHSHTCPLEVRQIEETRAEMVHATDRHRFLGKNSRDIPGVPIMVKKRGEEGWGRSLPTCTALRVMTGAASRVPEGAQSREFRLQSPLNGGRSPAPVRHQPGSAPQNQWRHVLGSGPTWAGSWEVRKPFTGFDANSCAYPALRTRRARRGCRCSNRGRQLARNHPTPLPCRPPNRSRAVPAPITA